MGSSAFTHSGLKLHHLQAFLAVAEEMSFSRAAGRLGIAQPPLSRQIQRLEASLNVTLFNRAPTQIELTRAGAIFAQQVRDILQQIDRSVELTQLVDKGSLGQLVLGIDSTSSTCDHVVYFLNKYQAQCPTANIQIKELRAEVQLTALQNNSIDVGFMALSDIARETPQNLSQAFESKTLLQEPWMVVLPCEHRLAQKPKISLSEIAEEPFIIEAHNIEEIMCLYENSFNQAPFIPNVIYAIHGTPLILSFVASGRGLSLVPASIEYNSPRHDVVYRLIEPPLEVSSLTAVWRSHETQTVVRSFVKMLQQIAH